RTLAIGHNDRRAAGLHRESISGDLIVSLISSVPPGKWTSWTFFMAFFSVHAILSIFLLGSDLANAAPLVGRSAESAIDSKLGNIETHFFSAVHENDTVEQRLVRIETMVFGETRTGDPSKRVDALLTTIGGLSPASISNTGRMEELNARAVPAGLNLKKLKAMDPIEAPIHDEHVIKGRIVSFPPDWTGQWGAHLKVRSQYHLKPDDRIKNQSTGLMILSFVPKGNQITLLPTNMYFPIISTTIEGSRISPDELKSLERKGALDTKRVLRAVPVLDLRDSNYVNVKGDKLETSTLLNKLSVIRPDVLEQDIILQAKIRSANGSQSATFYKETIVRLTRQSRTDILWGQVAHIGYDSNGVTQAQYITEGWLSTNWKPCAQEIEKLKGKNLASLGYDELAKGLGEMPLSH
ncbi:MAG: hypothetical protein K2X81_09240, partial [Candidatus Obscuribacterales bacterium]|nr:hypothetical protein [Candidatus Obscuribacterales bacterium]